MAQGFTKNYPQPAVGSVDVFINGVKQGSTSGTVIDFSIPSGVKSVKLTLVGVSTDGIRPITVRLGDSGGVDSTGYLGANSRLGSVVTSDNATSGWQITDVNDATRIFHGTATLTLHDEATNTWVFSFVVGRTDGASSIVGAGSMSLDNELTTVRLTTSGTPDDFDAGSVNIQYDNPNPVVAETVYISGGVVQRVHEQVNSTGTGTSLIPVDNTIPQVTEGTQFIDASITPTRASSVLNVSALINVSASAAGRWITCALFKDGAADAIAYASQYLDTSTELRQILINFDLDAGTVASQTYTVRVGPHAAATVYRNTGGAVYPAGSPIYCTLTLTEYAV